jgi:hypothetical protein
MLGLPLVAPLVLLPFGINAVIGVLMLSLTYAGIQYVIFATAVFFYIGRVKEIDHLKRLLYLAPLIFLPVQALGWILSGYYERLSDPNLTGIWSGLIPFAFYGLLIGYVYVGIIRLVYALFQKLGWIRSTL